MTRRQHEQESGLPAPLRFSRTRMWVAALSIIATAMAVSPASAAPSVAAGQRTAGSQDIIDLQDPGGLQLKLTDFKTWLISQAGLETSGYIESVNDAKAQSTTLLWKGRSPLQRKAIAEGAKRGITVTVEQRKYGRDELKRAALAAFHSVSAPGMPTVTSVAGITADFDGITVYYANRTGPVLTGSPGTLADAASEADAVARRTGVATRAANGPAIANSALTRLSDRSPFNAGGLMYSPSTGFACSSGFAIMVGGVSHTTTARHCDLHDYRVYNTTNGANSYGDGVVNSGDGAAREMTAAGSVLMFDGTWYNTDGYTKIVTGFGDVSVNDYVCTSGAMSGVHCGIKVKDLLVPWDDKYQGLPAFWTISGETDDGNVAACKGDSGGPVLTTAGTGYVRAVGMIQATSGDAFGDTVLTPQRCGKTVLFTAMRTIVNTISGASLRTG